MIMLRNSENMCGVKSIMLESRVSAPYGKDYGFNLYLYHGFYQVPKVIDPSRTSLDPGNTPGPTILVRKSRLSVVSHIN